jgi:hypothetical protein
VTCRHCRQAIPPNASTFVVPSNPFHGELVFCSIDCLDAYYTARQPEQES